MAATVVTEPASPTSVLARRAGTAAATSTSAASMSATAAATSSSAGGSPCRCRSVIRTQQMLTEMEWAGGPPASPSTNSVEQPPMSATRNGPGSGPAASSAVAPVNDSTASSSPVRTSGATPSTSLTMLVKSAALLASLVALV